MKKPEAWTKANWLIDLKMNGPEPIKVIYPNTKVKKKTQTQKRADYFNNADRFA